MDADLKAKWVEALRSGKYKQTRSALIETREDGARAFCCLGVLCDSAGALWESVDEERGYLEGMAIRASDGSFLSHSVLDLVGFDHSTQRTLANMNDAGKPFPEIADYIEKNL